VTPRYLSLSITDPVTSRVGCNVVSGRPLRSRPVAGVLHRVRVGLGPVLASRAPSPPPTPNRVGFPLRGEVYVLNFVSVRTIKDHHHHHDDHTHTPNGVGFPLLDGVWAE
jgi:hypothetical protein